MYAGQIYNDCLDSFQDLLAVLSSNPAITYTIYTDINAVSENILSLLSGHTQVVLKSPVSAEILFNKLKEFDAYVIISPKRGKDFVSTKYPDLIYFQIPIILYSAPGKLEGFLQKYERAKVVNAQSALKGAITGIKELGLNKVTFDLDKFNTTQLIQLLENSI